MKNNDVRAVAARIAELLRQNLQFIGVRVPPSAVVDTAIKISQRPSANHSPEIIAKRLRLSQSLCTEFREALLSDSAFYSRGQTVKPSHEITTADSSRILSNQSSALKGAEPRDLREAAKYLLNDHDHTGTINQDDESCWRHNVTMIKSLSGESINWNQTLRLYDSKVERDLVTGAVPEYRCTEQLGQSTNLSDSIGTEGIGKSSSLEKVRRFASMALTPDDEHTETLHGVSVFRQFLVLTSCEVLLRTKMVESAKICWILKESADPSLHLTTNNSLSESIAGPA
jgi:hypothetical protein